MNPEHGIAVFTDGSSNTKDGTGGWAWIALDTLGNRIEGSGRCIDTTNNQMELNAPTMALISLREKVGPADVLVYSDSQYVVLGATDITRKRNKNISWWKSLDRAIEDHNYVRFEHIKGHIGNKYNEQADKLAGNARKGKV